MGPIFYSMAAETCVEEVPGAGVPTFICTFSYKPGCYCFSPPFQAYSLTWFRFSLSFPTSLLLQ